MKLQVSENTINQVFELLKSQNNVSNIVLGDVIGVSRIAIYHSIKELKRRKWIRPKAERINNIVVYEILKRD